MAVGRALALTSALLAFASIAAPAVAAEDRDAGVVPGAYIVTLKSGDPASVSAEHGNRHGAKVDFVYGHAIRGYAAHMSQNAADKVAADSRVAAVVPDREVSTFAQTVPAGINRIDADVSSTAAGDGRGAVDVDIAIIDTGIDLKHRDLNVVGGVNCVAGGKSYADLNGHGTHVAGTAAAIDNNSGVVGVAPGARLWAVRVLNSQGSGTFSSIICGVDWVTARANVIDVANMSLGGSAPEGSCTDGGLHQAICASVNAGVTYTVAAGNSGADAQSFVPASYNEVVTVSAIADFDGKPGGTAAPACQYGNDDTFASFSNFGADVDLAAPGVCVYSTTRGGGYTTLSGTSMASPHVAGAAALYRSTHPGTSPAAVKAALGSAGTLDWTGNPDGTQEPLVNVAGF